LELDLPQGQEPVEVMADNAEDEQPEEDDD
jgi:hypothetical protein